VKIFLSHRSRDKATVRDFKEGLPKFLHPWLDEESLKWGDTLADKLQATIRADVDFLVIFLGSDTLNSEWVRRELGWALEREKELKRTFVLPVVLDEESAAKLPPELKGRLHLRLHDFRTRGIEALAADATEKLFHLVVQNYEDLAGKSSGPEQLRRVIEQSLCDKHEPRDFWTRPMLRLPLPGTVVDRALGVFEETIKVAGQSLREAIAGAKLDRVRANVFLPTSHYIADGDVCTLTIPVIDPNKQTRLQKNMANDRREVSIAFRPNEGATGKVFAKKQAVGVVTNPTWLGEKNKDKRKEIERWVYVPLHPEEDVSETSKSVCTESGKQDFNMRDFHNKSVEEDLTWIISMPIFACIKDRTEVVGVFNVDCREYQVEPKVLRAIYYRVVPFAGAVAGVLHDLPVDRVAIFKVPGE